MNPSNPTPAELRHTEQLFFAQMQMLSRNASRSLDYQFSDRWLVRA